MKKLLLLLMIILLSCSVHAALFKDGFESGDTTAWGGNDGWVVNNTGAYDGTYTACVYGNNLDLYKSFGDNDETTSVAWWRVQYATTRELNWIGASNGATGYASQKWIQPLSKNGYTTNMSFWTGTWYYGIERYPYQDIWFSVRVYYNDSSNRRIVWLNDTVVFNSTEGATTGDVGALVFSSRDAWSGVACIDNVSVEAGYVGPTPPTPTDNTITIDSINCTSCIIDNVTTTDTTPSFNTTTSSNAICRLSNETSLNYTTMNDTRNYTTTGNTIHFGTIIGTEALSSGLRTIQHCCQRSDGGNETCLNSSINVVNEPVTALSRINDGSATYGNAVNLDGFCNVTDADNDNISKYYYIWYKDGLLNTTGVLSKSYVQGTVVNVSTITSSITDNGDTWIFSCLGEDNLSLNSSYLNSTSASIYVLSITIEQNGLNEARKYELQTTANINITVNTTGMATWTVCLDIDDPSFGTSYRCLNNSNLSVNLVARNISYNTFNDGTTGKNLSFSFGIKECYQEHVNVSPGCGGLDSGNYTVTGTTYNIGLATDGDWGTGASIKILDNQAGILFLTYKKPYKALSTSLWEVKDNIGQVNLSLTDCWNYSTTNVSLRINISYFWLTSGQNVSWACESTNGWNMLRSEVPDSYGGGTFADAVFEEAIRWYYRGEEYNISIPYSRVSDVEEFFMSLSGVKNTSYPSNVSIEYLNDIIVIPGKLQGKRTNITSFTVGLKQEELVFTSGSSVIRYFNMSTNNPRFVTNFNFTFNISGIEIDNETLDFEEKFWNTTTIKTRTGSAPEYIYDDFSIGEVSNRWDGSSTDNWDVPRNVTNDVMISQRSTVEGGGTCQVKTSETASAQFWNKDIDIQDYKQLKVEAYLFARASCSKQFVTCNNNEFVTSQSILKFGLRDNLGNTYSIITYDSEAGCGFNADSETGTSNTSYDIQFRDDGFIWVNSVKKWAYLTSRSYYLWTYGYETAFGPNPAAFSYTDIYSINLSGFTNTYVVNLTWDSNTNVSLESDTIAVGSNVSRAKLTTFKRGSGTELLYLSSDNGTTWESTTSGIMHVFTNPGKLLKVRLNISSVSNSSPYIIDSYTVDVSPSAVENITIDVGNDGTRDYEYNGTLNDTTSPRIVNLDSGDFSNYLSGSNCPGETCLVPVVFSVDSAGSMNYSYIYGGQNTSKITFNTTLIERYNVSYDKNISFTVSSDINGIIEVGDILTSYLGDGTINLTARVYTTALSLLDSVSQVLYWRHSPFNVTLPSGVEYYDLYPSSYNAKNVQPYGQKDGTPIFNFTSLAETDNVSIELCLNETIDSCLNITWSENYNLSSGYSIKPTYNCTTSINLTTNFNSNDYINIYNFWNLTNCTTTAFKFFEYNVLYDSWCKDCVRVD